MIQPFEPIELHIKSSKLIDWPSGFFKQGLFGIGFNGRRHSCSGPRPDPRPLRPS